MRQPVKTRIKVTTDVQGNKSYVPQHRCWFIWYDFNDFEGYSTFTHTRPFMHGKKHCSSYSSIEYAQQDIDKYIKAFHAEELALDRKKRTTVTYVKYP